MYKDQYESGSQMVTLRYSGTGSKWSILIHAPLHKSM